MKTYRIVFFLFSTSILSFLYSCKPAPRAVSEDEAYALLNEVIFDDTLIMREIYYKFSGLELSDEMKKEFTEEEVEFMEAQIRGLKITKVKPDKIVYFHRGYKKGDFVELIKKKDTSYTSISFPIISPDRKKLLIHTSYNCNCILGGSGSDNLYIKKNGRWRFVKTFNAWIS